LNTFKCNYLTPLVSKGLSYKLQVVSVVKCNQIDSVVQMIRHRTCYSQVVGSGWASLRSGLGQATYICVPQSPSSTNWYQPSGLISMPGKATAGW